MRGPKLAGTLLGIGILALVLAGCGRWLPHGHDGGPPSGITIVAPGDRTQVARDGTLDVIVRLDRPLARSTLRVAIVADGHAPVDVTTRLHPVALGLGAALTAADLSPGINRVVARGTRRVARGAPPVRVRHRLLGAGGGHDACVALRLPRPEPVPAAVPERLVHHP